MQWEYHQELTPPGQEIQTANRAGEDGWELISCTMIAIQASPLAQQPQAAMNLIFKRPKVSNGKPKDSKLDRNELFIS